MKTILTYLAVAILGSALYIVVPAQSIRSPEKGSTERKAVLDALRSPVERDLKQDIAFVVENFNISGSWAFVSGSLQTSGGERPDFSRTQYAEAIANGAFDNNFFALLKKTKGKWKVVTHAIGCTDVCYVDWWRRYRAPKAIFPYTE